MLENIHHDYADADLGFLYAILRIWSTDLWTEIALHMSPIAYYCCELILG